MCLLVSKKGLWGKESTKGDEAKPQEGNNKEAKEVIDSRAQWVAYLKKKEPIPTVVVYHHPHHIEKQHHQDKGVSINTLMHQQGTRKETNQEVHGGLPTLQEDIRLENQSHGNTSTMWNTVARQQLDIMFIFH
jgi:hypothetical protein